HGIGLPIDDEVVLRAGTGGQGSARRGRAPRRLQVRGASTPLALPGGSRPGAGAASAGGWPNRIGSASWVMSKTESSLALSKIISSRESPVKSYSPVSSIASTGQASSHIPQ